MVAPALSDVLTGTQTLATGIGGWATLAVSVMVGFTLISFGVGLIGGKKKKRR